MLTVIAVATPAHATRDAGRVEDPLGVLARVRAALVGVMEQPGVRTPALQRHVERFDREVTVVHRADGPPHDESREQIEDRGQIQLATRADDELGGIAHPPLVGRVRPELVITRSVRPPRVRRALGGAVDRGLPVAAGGAGCPGSDRDASFGGPVPALRVSSDPDLPETRGARDEHRSHASALAPGGVAGPAAAPSAPGGHGTAPAADRPEPRVGVRLRVRPLCESADAQMPDDRRRVAPCMPSD